MDRAATAETAMKPNMAPVPPDGAATEATGPGKPQQQATAAAAPHLEHAPPAEAPSEEAATKQPSESQAMDRAATAETAMTPNIAPVPPDGAATEATGPGKPQQQATAAAAPHLEHAPPAEAPSEEAATKQPSESQAMDRAGTAETAMKPNIAPVPPDGAATEATGPGKPQQQATAAAAPHLEHAPPAEAPSEEAATKQPSESQAMDRAGTAETAMKPNIAPVPPDGAATEATGPGKPQQQATAAAAPHLEHAPPAEAPSEEAATKQPSESQAMDRAGTAETAMKPNIAPVPPDGAAIEATGPGTIAATAPHLEHALPAKASSEEAATKQPSEPQAMEGAGTAETAMKPNMAPVPPDGAATEATGPGKPQQQATAAAAPHLEHAPPAEAPSEEAATKQPSESQAMEGAATAETAMKPNIAPVPPDGAATEATAPGKPQQQATAAAAPHLEHAPPAKAPSEEAALLPSQGKQSKRKHVQPSLGGWLTPKKEVKLEVKEESPETVSSGGSLVVLGPVERTRQTRQPHTPVAGKAKRLHQMQIAFKRSGPGLKGTEGRKALEELKASRSASRTSQQTPTPPEKKRQCEVDDKEPSAKRPRKPATPAKSTIGQPAESPRSASQQVSCLVLREEAWMWFRRKDISPMYLFRSYALNNLPASFHILVTDTLGNECEHVGTIEFDKCEDVRRFYPWKSYMLNALESKTWAKRVRDKEKVCAWRIQAVQPLDAPIRVRFASTKFRNRHFTCKKRHLYQVVDMLPPAPSLFETAKFFVKLLPPRFQERLAQVAHVMDQHVLRVGTACSGSDICVVAIRALLEAMNHQFGVPCQD